MRSAVRIAFALLVPTLSLAAAGQAPTGAQAPGQSTYRQLRDLRPDGRSVEVSGFEIRRDVFLLQFDRGRFHFLSPVDGHTVGAVFLGEGRFRLTPASDAERRHLALVSGDDELEVLSDSFAAMVLFFHDGTDLDISGAGAVTEGTASTEAARLVTDLLALQRKELRTNFHLRLLESLRNSSIWGTGPFLAFFDGQRLPPALLVLDPMGCDALRLTSNWSRERAFMVVRQSGTASFWYSSDPRVGGEPRASSWADALHYDLEVEIHNNTGIEGSTTIRFASLARRLEILPVLLMPELRISQVAFRRLGAEAWQPAAFIQEAAKEDADAVVILPEALAEGEVGELRIEYAGEQVLYDAGDDNYVVRARDSWYPNLGAFTDTASYAMTYKVPKDLQVISVGEEVESHDAGEQHVQVWRSDQPIRVAGFNYGQFKKLEQPDEGTGLKIEVYTNPGQPEIIDLINQALGGSSRLGEQGPRIPISSELTPEQNEALAGRGLVGQIDSADLAKSALIDGINTARVSTSYFGALPQRRVAITQQSQWSFGQSWPSLVFMPYLAFLSSTHRAQLTELDFGYLSDAQIERLGYHEVAHQWWGHLVGWKSYRDQWLSEGFAEFTAGLVTEMVEGRSAADEFWEAARDRILEKPRGGKIPNYQAGPISLGYRLATDATPGAAGAMIYSKGAYLLHMLRMMMWDNAGSPPDHRFMAMMKDFATSFAGQAASNLDFQRVVERHLLPQMNATGNGSMAWFFDQWLHGTEIPAIEADLKAERQPGEEYRITGTVRQLGVSESFRSFVPIYVDFGKDRLARLGGVLLLGNQPQTLDIVVRLPDKPKRVVVNAHYDVLAMK